MVLEVYRMFYHHSPKDYHLRHLHRLHRLHFIRLLYHHDLSHHLYHHDRAQH
jgi:hypothetical protein